MDTLFGIAVVGVWIAISVVGLKRAYGSRGPSPQQPKFKKVPITGDVAAALPACASTPPTSVQPHRAFRRR